MTVEKIYYYNLTDYPKIYRTTYWGNFRYREDNFISKDIIENRNNFIKDFDIKSHGKSLPKYMLNKCHKHINVGDHVEKYKTNDNKLIIINSPYGSSEKEKKELEELGYVEVKPMYNHSAKTYMYITDIENNYKKPQIMENFICEKKYNVLNKTDKNTIKFL